MFDIKSHNQQAFQFIDNSVDIVNRLCEPFFDRFNLNIFSYMRFYNDGKIFRLASHKDWSRKFFECEYYCDPNMFQSHMNMLTVGSHKYRILTGVPQGEHLMALHSFNVWNILFYYKRSEDFLECWGVGTLPENTQAVSLYMNNLNVMHDFIFYFREKAEHLLQFSDQQKLLISNFNPAKVTNDKELYNTKNIEMLINKRAIFEHNNNIIYFTPMEAKCLKYLLEAKTPKEIGRLINISHRTVENYISNMRLKLGCKKKSELIDIILKEKSIN